MKTILIREEFRDDHVTRAAGEELRKQILHATRAGEKVELNFEGLKIGSASFFDESIAKLREEGWSRADLDRAISFRELHPLDRRVLELALKYRGWGS